PALQEACARDMEIQPDAELAIVRPEEFETRFSAPLRIGLMVFEASRWPTSWVEAAKRFLDIVIVPSSFCRKGLIRSGLAADKIHVIGHGVDTEVFRSDARPVRHQGPLRLLFVGTPTRRKGLDILLSAMEQTLQPFLPIELTIKSELWEQRSDTWN